MPNEEGYLIIVNIKRGGPLFVPVGVLFDYLRWNHLPSVVRTIQSL